MTLTVALAILGISVILQALFAGYETGFVTANRLRIRHLAEEEEQPWAVRLWRHLGKPDQMLATLLIGTNLATVAATIAVSKQLGDSIALAVVAPAMLVFGEIIPKSVFRTHPNRLTLWLLPVVRVFYAALAPVAGPVAWMTRLLLRTGVGEERYISPLMSTREDVRSLVDESAEHGTIQPEEQRMIHSIINLQTTQAKEVMVPRIGIQALPQTATRAELLALFEQTGRTRIPIYADTIDNIIGVANAYDVLLDTAPHNGDIKRFIHEVVHVPDTIKLQDLLARFKHSKHHMAIVTDEYGGTDGLITLEDIVEQIFGQIHDEHDREERPLHQVGPDAYVIDARMPLEDAAAAMGVPLVDEEVKTVGGWLMHIAGRIPVQGEVVRHAGYQVTVLEGGVNHVSKIRLDVAPEARVGEARVPEARAGEKRAPETRVAGEKPLDTT